MGGIGIWCVLGMVIIQVVSGKMPDPNHAHHPEENANTKVGSDSSCTNQLCTDEEECCPGTICVAHGSSKLGVCVGQQDQSEGKTCFLTHELESQCRTGLQCEPIHMDFYPLGLCVDTKRKQSNKKFFEPCDRTIECETKSQLCCRAQMAPGRTSNRKICSYFSDPLEQCIF